MHDVTPFAIVMVVVALALLLAVAFSRLSERIGIPTPAIFLIGAAVASDLVHRLSGLTIEIDQRIVTVCLVLILFDGGMHIGWARFRSAAVGVVWLGVAGTIVTAAALAVAAHGLFGYGWHTALLIGTALAPTDPAVVFSVLGRREISGRSGTLLEGESGANDPVGIALMISLLGAGSGSSWSAVGGGVLHFVLQMGIGVAVGAVGGYLLAKIMHKVPLPNEALYPIQTIAFAALIYAAATVCEGSGFLAVFLAGIIVGDLRAPYKREIERFASAVSSLGEIVAFTVLGLSVSLHGVFHDGKLWTGVALAALLILVVRPVLVGLVLIPIRLDRGERIFVLWAGLKGAVPILLGTYILSENVSGAAGIFDIIFIVVTLSVIVQGGLVPSFARWLKVPMQLTEQEPWSLGIRFRSQPEGLHRYVVAAESAADGCAVGALGGGDGFWISMVSRGGHLIQVRGDTVLLAGDEVFALVDKGTALDPVFGS